MRPAVTRPYAAVRRSAGLCPHGDGMRRIESTAALGARAAVGPVPPAGRGEPDVLRFERRMVAGASRPHRGCANGAAVGGCAASGPSGIKASGRGSAPARAPSGSARRPPPLVCAGSVSTQVRGVQCVRVEAGNSRSVRRGGGLWGVAVHARGRGRARAAQDRRERDRPRQRWTEAAGSGAAVVLLNTVGARGVGSVRSTRGAASGQGRSAALRPTGGRDGAGGGSGSTTSTSGDVVDQRCERGTVRPVRQRRADRRWT